MIGAEIQKALFDALQGVCDRVWDNPPPKPEFPYIVIGDEQVIDDGNTCSNGWEVYADVAIYSRSKSRSKVEAKTLRAQVTTAILAIDKIDGFNLIDVKMDTARIERDTDEITEVATLTFRFLTQEE